MKSKSSYFEAHLVHTGSSVKEALDTVRLYESKKERERPDLRYRLFLKGLRGTPGSFPSFTQAPLSKTRYLVSIIKIQGAPPRGCPIPGGIKHMLPNRLDPRRDR